MGLIQQADAHLKQLRKIRDLQREVAGGGPQGAGAPGGAAPLELREILNNTRQMKKLLRSSPADDRGLL